MRFFQISLSLGVRNLKKEKKEKEKKGIKLRSLLLKEGEMCVWAQAKGLQKN